MYCWRKTGARNSVNQFRMHSNTGALIIILPQAIVKIIKLPVYLVVGSILAYRDLAKSSDDSWLALLFDSALHTYTHI